MEHPFSDLEPKIYRFHNHTDAAMLACRMRADGHHAYLLDESTSWLWGPLAVGGIRVLVYPRIAADGGDEPDECGPESVAAPQTIMWLPDWVSIIVLAFVAMGLIFHLKFAVAGALAISGFIAVLVAICLPLVPLMVAMTRGIRSHQETSPWALSWIVAILILLVFGHVY